MDELKQAMQNFKERHGNYLKYRKLFDDIYVLYYQEGKKIYPICTGIISDITTSVKTLDKIFIKYLHDLKREMR